MNRKATKEQNDISKIIGNLPRRLQLKISQETGVCSTTDDDTSNLVKDGVETKDGSLLHQQDVRLYPESSQCLERVNQPLKKSEVIITGTPVDQKEMNSCIELMVPGILRIGKAKDANDHGKENTVIRGKSKEVAISEQTLHVNNNYYPVWFDEIISKDIACVEMLPSIHNFFINSMHQHSVHENWDNFVEYRQKTKSIFSQLLLNELKFCCEKNVESYFWKLLYYNLIEYLKREVPQYQNDSVIKKIIEDGLQFYTNLLEYLVQKYIHNGSEKAHLRKYEFIAKVSAQKILVCLGDLSRYKTKNLQINDYSDASKFYHRAQNLIPSNGIPYNQLAILAIYTKKKLDAVYYHMRSLMSSNAIISARESLKVLFDEMRKTYEEKENKSPRNLAVINQENKTMSLRKEIWIYPDGIRRLQRSNDNKRATSEENIFDDLSSAELLRNFTSLYLYIIGKLFSGVGLENFEEHQRKLLLQLKAILNRRPLIMSRNRLLKITSLNIFVVEHNKQIDSRKEIRYYSFNVSNQIFGVLIQKSVQIISELKAFKSAEPGLIDLNSLLQYVKIWCDWLSLNVGLWEPIRNQEQLLVNPWAELLKLFSCLTEIQSHYKYTDTCCTLEEDYFLNGFTPILSSISVSSFNDFEKKISNEIEQFQMRIYKIILFSEVFHQNQNLLIYNDIKFSLQGSSDSAQEDKVNENIIINGINKLSTNEVERTSVGEETNTQISKLFKLKKELEAKVNTKRMYSEKLERILKYVDTNVYIEVQPRYLLPDTNCFIDCLEDFQKLNKHFKRYTLIVPLTVVRELDGLAKGSKIESYKNSHTKKSRIHHFDDVSTRAKKALEFVRTSYNNIKCATTKGSIINASMFALVEELHASNDDKILATALALSKQMNNETITDGKSFIQTELVLITSDRNLRVKALSRNLAVSELSEFLQWANDSK